LHASANCAYELLDDREVKSAPLLCTRAANTVEELEDERPADSREAKAAIDDPHVVSRGFDVDRGLASGALVACDVVHGVRQHCAWRVGSVCTFQPPPVRS
jgi:hypothetical protein